MRYRCLTTLLLLLLLLTSPALAGMQPGDPLPDFTLTTMTGKPFNSAGLRSRQPVVLIFWATWCQVCKREIPRLNKLFSTLSPRGVRFLGINVGINDSTAKALRYARKYQIRYPLFFDEGSRLSRRFGILGTPTIVIADHRGIIRYRGNTIPDNIEQIFGQTGQP